MRIGNYRNPSFWTNEKTEMLLELRAAKAPTRTIADQLGTTVDAVNGRLRTLGAFRRPHFRWTPEDDVRLIAYYLKPKSDRRPMKAELRSWPASPTPEAAYTRAIQMKLTKNIMTMKGSPGE